MTSTQGSHTSVAADLREGDAHPDGGGLGVDIRMAGALEGVGGK